MHANPDGCTPEALDEAAEALERAAQKYEAKGTPGDMLAASKALGEAVAKRESATYQREMVA